MMIKEDVLFSKPEQAQSKYPGCFGLVYFKSPVGLRILLVLYLMNQVYMVKKVNGN